LGDELNDGFLDLFNPFGVRGSKFEFLLFGLNPFGIFYCGIYCIARPTILFEEKLWEEF
jgi:hypothetical protein